MADYVLTYNFVCYSQGLIRGETIARWGNVGIYRKRHKSRKTPLSLSLTSTFSPPACRHISECQSPNDPLFLPEKEFGWAKCENGHTQEFKNSRIQSGCWFRCLRPNKTTNGAFFRFKSFLFPSVPKTPQQIGLILDLVTISFIQLNRSKSLIPG